MSGSGGVSPRGKKRKMNSDGPDERYTGFLKRYSTQEAYGFISNPELKSKYDADVYLHKNVYEQVLPPFREGEPVEFSIHLNSNNKPQACYLCRAGGNGGSGYGGGFGGRGGRGAGGGGRGRGGWGNPPW